MLGKYLLKKMRIRAGEMAQVEECLPSKCEALRSNPSMVIKKKEK
jgi:hypothetical protein